MSEQLIRTLCCLAGLIVGGLAGLTLYCMARVSHTVDESMPQEETTP